MSTATRARTLEEIDVILGSDFDSQSDHYPPGRVVDFAREVMASPARIVPAAHGHGHVVVDVGQGRIVTGNDNYGSEKERPS
jgi:hypothetical protein